MYGEKVEEAEELRLDLADVKEMYKTQIQELIQAGKQWSYENGFSNGETRTVIADNREM